MQNVYTRVIINFTVLIIFEWVLLINWIIYHIIRCPIKHKCIVRCSLCLIVNLVCLTAVIKTSINTIWLPVTWQPPHATGYTKHRYKDAATLRNRVSATSVAMQSTYDLIVFELCPSCQILCCSLLLINFTWQIEINKMYTHMNHIKNCLYAYKNTSEAMPCVSTFMVSAAGTVQSWYRYRTVRNSFANQLHWPLLVTIPEVIVRELSCMFNNLWRLTTKRTSNDLRETHWSRVTHIHSSVNFPSLVQIMASRLVGAKPLSEPMMEYC